MAGAIMSSTGQSWMTPPNVIDLVLEVYDGQIDLDPSASSGLSTVPARLKYTGPEVWGGNGLDGLSQPWWGWCGDGIDVTKVFVNPPYGRNPPAPGILDGKKMTHIGHWLQRCSQAAHNGSRVIAVVPAAVDTGHWQRWVWPHASSVCFHNGRMRFYMRDEATKLPVPAPATTFHACAILHFGREVEKFNRVFRRIGTLVTPNIEVAA